MVITDWGEEAFVGLSNEEGQRFFGGWARQSMTRFGR